MNFKQRDSGNRGKKPIKTNGRDKNSRNRSEDSADREEKRSPRTSDRGERTSRYAADRGEKRSPRTSDRGERTSRYAADRGEKRSPRSSDRGEKRSQYSSDRERQKPHFAKDRNSFEGGDKTSRPQKNEQNQLFKTFKKPLKEIFIWGRRTVEAYLSNLHQQGKEIDNSKYALHIIVDKSNKAPSQLKPSVESAQLLGIKIVPHQSTETWPIADSGEELNHQRICLKIPEYPIQYLSEAVEVIKSANLESQHGCIGLVLDQIQDPRNFGAIIRSAAFFGVKFIVYGTDRQADISSLVLKTAAGGAFSISLIPAVNINRALQQIKEAGAWIVGTALGENSSNLKDLPIDRAWVGVLGNEEKGLRNEVLKNCDYVVQIPGGKGTVDSLNVSVAAGILIHSLSH
ncbi:23S rRNA (guanosine(2251)-2'-O)-methyltransferase RlmB [Pigmentibacter sp. JX0631]|uniref:23S rRNA (guanosine(2251)-2'-O)-methyltransferase RlmB n=1 Tax=Pigmentibacter sp. JX0631 TaxID=2976982 RepID=UPI0024699443|nr:23S rRNA (guanosine(2251)-2'-O)-methyltransferase RlmB [Pigmentibacter sp. JX0631]WGL58806.1 23S rRNA (guanosine(2251)-2'-O)-methyltransferase RlmB [Pigmentibacter sp. JX0631]